MNSSFTNLRLFPVVALLVFCVGCNRGGNENSVPDNSSEATTETTAVNTTETTTDTSSGEVGGTSTSTVEVVNEGVLPVFDNCEDAVKAPTNGEPCTPVEQRAFQLWGQNLSKLYGSNVRLGNIWQPNNSDGDYELNEAALFACQYVDDDLPETVWLEEQIEIYSDFSPAVHEALFDAAMVYVCPALNYFRQTEWDNYTPSGGNGTTTTTETSLVTAPIKTAEGVLQFTCSDILSVISDEVCGESFEFLFGDIVAANANSFDSFVYHPNIGFFGGDDITVGEAAFAGLWACSFIVTEQGYGEFDESLRKLFTMISPADTVLVYAAAEEVLC